METFKIVVQILEDFLPKEWDLKNTWKNVFDNSSFVNK